MIGCLEEADGVQLNTERGDCGNQANAEKRGYRNVEVEQGAASCPKDGGPWFFLST